MINLNELFASSPTATLIEPRDYTGLYVPQLRLLLTDTQTGHMQVLTIEADAFLEPRVAPMLALSVEQVDEPEFSGGPDEYVDDGQSPVVDEVEPEATWRVASDGTVTEFVQHDVERVGLFG